MKTKNIFLLALFVSCAIFVASSAGTLQGKPEGCGSCVVLTGTPNETGQYCGPTSGTFTIGPSGTVLICGLCPGTYEFCTSSGGYTYLVVDAEALYYATIDTERTCPCDN